MTVDRSALSLLDRLLDDAPELRDLRDIDVARREHRFTTWESLREGMTRDMEKLLSTRPQKTEFPPGSRLGSSIIAYGLPPGTDEARERRILEAVERFESRLEHPVLVAANEADVAAAIAAAVRWNGEMRRVLVKVRESGDGFRVGIYE